MVIEETANNARISMSVKKRPMFVVEEDAVTPKEISIAPVLMAIAQHHPLRNVLISMNVTSHVDICFVMEQVKFVRILMVVTRVSVSTI